MRGEKLLKEVSLTFLSIICTIIPFGKGER
jgi:hypothetical protein